MNRLQDFLKTQRDLKGSHPANSPQNSARCFLVELNTWLLAKRQRCRTIWQATVWQQSTVWKNKSHYPKIRRGVVCTAIEKKGVAADITNCWYFEQTKMSITNASPKVLTCSTCIDISYLHIVNQVIEFSSRVKVSLTYVLELA